MKHMKDPERPARAERPGPSRPPRAPMGRDRAFKAALAREYGVEEVPRRLQRRTERTLQSLPDTLPRRSRPVLRVIRGAASAAAVLAASFAVLVGLNATNPQFTEALPGLGQVFAAMNGPRTDPSPSPAPTPTPKPQFQSVTALSKGSFPGILIIDDAWTDGNALTLSMSISTEKKFYSQFGAEDSSMYEYLFLAPRAETDGSEQFSTGVLTVSSDSGYRDFSCGDLIFTRDEDSGRFTALWQLDLEDLEVEDSIKLSLEMPDMSASYSTGGSSGAYYDYAGFSASFSLDVDRSRDRVLGVQSGDGPVTLRSVDYAPGRVELDVSLPYLGMVGDLCDENEAALEYPLGIFPRLTCMDGDYEYDLSHVGPDDLDIYELAPDGSTTLDLHYTFKAATGLSAASPRDLKGPLTLTLYEFPQEDGPLGRVTAEFTIDLSTGRAYPSKNYEKYGYEKGDPYMSTRQRLEDAMTGGLLLAPSNAGDAINGGAYGPYSQFTLYSDISYSGRQFEVYCYLDGKLEGSFGFVIGEEEYEDPYVQYYTYTYSLASSGHEYLSTTVIYNHSSVREDGGYISFDRLELRDTISGEVYIPDMAEAWRESYIELLAKDPQAEHDSMSSESAGSVG